MSGRTEWTGPGGRSVIAELESRFGRRLSLLSDTDGADAPVVEEHARFSVAARLRAGRLLCDDTDLARQVVLKLLPEQEKGDLPSLERFALEARILGQLRHPSIPPVYELGRWQDDRPYLAQKPVKGRTLSELLRERDGPADQPARFLAIFEQLCQTIAYAHAGGVMHLGLEPDVVAVGPSGEVEVLGWDRARRQGGGVRETSVLGSPCYMPPEQAMGEEDRLDERADVFSLGAILCEILTGAPPRDKLEALVGSPRYGFAEAQQRLDHCDADARLVRIARVCLSPSQKLRPRSAGEVAKAMSGRLESAERRARKSRALAALADRKERREKWRRLLAVAATALVLFLLVAGGGSVLWVDFKGEKQSVQSSTVLRDALGTARLKASRARNAGRYDPSAWAAALAEAQRARQVAESGDPEDVLRDRASALLAALSREQVEAERAWQGRLENEALSARMSGIRGSMVDDVDPARMDREFAGAFREHGFEIEGKDEAGVADLVRASPVEDDLVAALGDWLLFRRLAGGEPGKILAVANAADPDGWRTRLRKAVAAGDAATLLELARTAGEEQRTHASVVLLADALGASGVPEDAVRVLRDLTAHRPGESAASHLAFAFWAARLARPDPDVAVRHAAAAVAIAPEREDTWVALGLANLAAGERLEAVRVLTEAAERFPESERVRRHLEAASR